VWSSLSHSSDATNEGFLAIGSASGNIHIWKSSPSDAISDNRYTQSQALEFQLDCALPDSDAGIITHVAWSPWFSLPASHASILAASRMDGSIHLCLIHRTPSAQKLSCNSTRELLSPQRIRVTKLSWTRRDNELILGMARNGIFSVSVHSARASKPLASKLAHVRHDNFSPAAGSPPPPDEKVDVSDHHDPLDTRQSRYPPHISTPSNLPFYTISKERTHVCTISRRNRILLHE
jgi:hypothetical protein